jgi:hypothetical protein
MMRLFVERSHYRGAFQFWLEDEQRGKMFVAQPIVFKEASDADMAQIPEPTFTVSSHIAEGFMQMLMDDLWHVGVRPTGVKAPDAQIAALKDHLDDMRRLVFEVKR